MKNASVSGLAIILLFTAILGCGKIGLPGNVDLFEGDNAAKAAQKIKEKVGEESIRVIRGEIRKDTMQLTIQAPNDPKNMDVYKFENGIVSGPEPVQVMRLGNLEMTADKYNPTDLSEINFEAIPGMIKNAIELSKLDEAKVDLISMDQQNSEFVNPKLKEEKKQNQEELKKQIEQKSDECFNQPTFPAKCLDELMALQDNERGTSGPSETKWAFTWRLFVQGPRGRKDFWADKSGKLNETPF